MTTARYRGREYELLNVTDGAEYIRPVGSS